MAYWAMPLPGLMRKKAGGLNVADVFKTTLYAGNSATQTITNGLDFLNRGGLSWIKRRNLGLGHLLRDTVRGTQYGLTTNNTSAQVDGDSAYLMTLLSNGYSWTTTDNDTNNSTGTYVAWDFRRAPKFFDIVTYTGNGASGRQIAHGLGAAPGFITTKSLSTTGDWNSYHRSATGDLILNSTAAQAGSPSIITAADATTFTVSGAANTNGVTYIAYFFAHDPSPEGIIQCGNYTGNGSTTGPTITLGWQPQYLLIKRTDSLGEWCVFDSGRNPSNPATLKLYPDENWNEDTTPTTSVSFLSGGFSIGGSSGFQNAAGGKYIYMAIRAEGI